MKRSLFLLAALAIISGGCGTVQSIVKSTFPYTTTLVVPASSQPGAEYSAISLAKSFDQSSGSKVSKVRISSAKLESATPGDYNIGSISAVSIFISGEDGKDEVLVASRTDIGPNVGNSVVLDIDNSHTLDEYIRKPKIRVHMVYKVRGAAPTDVSLKLTLAFNAHSS